MMSYFSSGHQSVWCRFLFCIFVLEALQSLFWIWWYYISSEWRDVQKNFQMLWALLRSSVKYAAKWHTATKPEAEVCVSVCRWISAAFPIIQAIGTTLATISSTSCRITPSRILDHLFGLSGCNNEHHFEGEALVGRAWVSYNMRCGLEEYDRNWTWSRQQNE